MRARTKWEFHLTGLGCTFWWELGMGLGMLSQVVTPASESWDWGWAIDWAVACIGTHNPGLAGLIGQLWRLPCMAAASTDEIESWDWADWSGGWSGWTILSHLLAYMIARMLLVESSYTQKPTWDYICIFSSEIGYEGQSHYRYLYVNVDRFLQNKPHLDMSSGSLKGVLKIYDPFSK